MIKALKKGEVVWYAPDYDLRPALSVFVPLFAVEQAADHDRNLDAGTDVRRMSGALRSTP